MISHRSGISQPNTSVSGREQRVSERMRPPLKILGDLARESPVRSEVRCPGDQEIAVGNPGKNQRCVQGLTHVSHELRKQQPGRAIAVGRGHGQVDRPCAQATAEPSVEQIELQAWPKLPA